MIPSNLYGRSLHTWLCYQKLPMYIGTKLFVLDLSRVYTHELCVNAQAVVVCR